MVHDPFYDLFPRSERPPFVAGRTALVTIDMQYLDAHPDGWMGRVTKKEGKPHLLEERFAAIGEVVPRIGRLQDAFRQAGQEVMHVRVKYRTDDGRDAPRAYMPAPGAQPVGRDEKDDEFLGGIGPVGDEMVFSKTSASVFSSTAIEGVLRRMGIDHLVVTGLVTDGCVELSARDACDRGFAVTLVTDATCASTRAAHEDALSRMTDGGFIAARTTDDVARDIASLTPQSASATATS
jgi:nicotinamidase-related amidase